jgi:hypothetical protein
MEVVVGGFHNNIEIRHNGIEYQCVLYLFGLEWESLKAFCKHGNEHYLP